MNANKIFIFSMTIFLLSCNSFSQFCPANPKIQVPLCKKLDSIQLNQQLPVQIILMQPVFHISGCEDHTDTPPNPVRCTQGEIDSTTAYWGTHKSDVLNLFSKYSLYDTSHNSKQMDTTYFVYSRLYNALASKSTILAMVTESLVVSVGLLVQATPVSILVLPDTILTKTTFPFDTVITGCVKLTDSNTVSYTSSQIAIPRYGLSIFLYNPPSPTICPQPQHYEFHPYNMNTISIRIPADDTYLISARNCCGSIPNCTSSVKIDPSYKTHEYRFPTKSSYLYMKILDDSRPDSIKIRFNTSSFLQANSVQNNLKQGINKINTNDNIREMLLNGNFREEKISVYTVTGKKISPCSNFKKLFGRNSIFIVKINENGKNGCFKRVLFTYK